MDEESEALEKLRFGVDIDRAFAVLVELHKDMLFDYLCFLCRNPADADELVQQSFIDAFKHIQTYDPQLGPFDVWLRRIAKRRWMMMCRSRHREAAAMEMLSRCGPFSAPGPAEGSIRRAREEAVWVMLGRLDFYDAVIAVLHWMEGRTYAEISRELRMPERTAKMHALRARHLLRIQLLVAPIPPMPVVIEEDICMEWQPKDSGKDCPSTPTPKLISSPSTTKQ